MKEGFPAKQAPRTSSRGAGSPEVGEGARGVQRWNKISQAKHRDVEEILKPILKNAFKFNSRLCVDLPCRQAML